MDKKDPSLTFSLEGGYAPAPESTEHIHLQEAYGQFIAGEFTSPDPERELSVTNPATEEKLGSVTVADQDEVNRAVGSARDCFDNATCKSVTKLFWRTGFCFSFQIFIK